MSKYKIQISEPWDFQLQDGTNEFVITGAGIIRGPDRRAWQTEYFLVDVDEPFEVDGELVRQLACAPRYAGDTMDMVINGKCTVGISRLRPGSRCNSGGAVNTADIAYFAIGSIQALDSSV